MEPKIESVEYTVYHDETKSVNSKKYQGHVLLFVPDRIKTSIHHPLFGEEILEYSPSKQLYDKISEIRDSYKMTRKLHFTDISGKKWSLQDDGILHTTNLAVEALRHHGQTCFGNPLHLKLAVIFYPITYNSDLYGGDSRKEKDLRHAETIMRIILKGALQYFFNDIDNVIIKNMITDGSPYHREIDSSRVLHRLRSEEIFGRTPLKDHIHITDDAHIIALESDHKNHAQNSEEYTHSHFLQLADILLGGTIRSSYEAFTVKKFVPQIGSELPDHKKNVISYPIKTMLDKKKRGSGFKHSGHYNSFSLTLLEFINDKPDFQNVPQTVFENTPEFDFGV